MTLHICVDQTMLLGFLFRKPSIHGNVLFCNPVVLMAHNHRLPLAQPDRPHLVPSCGSYIIHDFIYARLCTDCFRPAACKPHLIRFFTDVRSSQLSYVVLGSVRAAWRPRNTDTAFFGGALTSASSEESAGRICAVS